MHDKVEVESEASHETALASWKWRHVGLTIFFNIFFPQLTILIYSSPHKKIKEKISTNYLCIYQSFSFHPNNSKLQPGPKPLNLVQAHCILAISGPNQRSFIIMIIFLKYWFLYLEQLQTLNDTVFDYWFGTITVESCLVCTKLRKIQKNRIGWKPLKFFRRTYQYFRL